jgi:hypothetical protein
MGEHSGIWILPKMTTQRTCSGDGDCLTQTFDENTYGKNPEYSCQHDCQPQECPNFRVCGTLAPRWYFGCHGGRCWGCKYKFGKNLTFLDEPQECPVCLETGLCVIQPNCSHSICIACFKRTRVNGPPRTGEPQFPYPDREDEYFETGNESSNPMFHDPLIVKYNADWNLWQDDWDRRYASEENLRKCPLCRS